MTWKRSKILLGSGIAAGVFLLLNLGAWAYTNNKVYPGIAVKQVALGGTSKDRVAQQLQDQVQKYNATVLVGNEPIGQNLSELGVRPDVEKTAQKAYRQGRHMVVPVIGMISSLLQSPLQYEVAIDQEQFARVIDALNEKEGVPAKNAALVFEDEKVRIAPGQEGSAVDTKQAKQTARQAVASLNEEVVLQFRTAPPAITEQELREQVLEKARKAVGMELTLIGPEREFSPSKETIFSWLSVGPAGDSDGLELTVNAGQVAAYVAEVAKQVNRDPVTKVIIRRGGKVVREEGGLEGIHVNQDQLKQRVVEQMRQQQVAELTIPTEPVAFETRYRDLPARDQPQITYTYCVVFRGTSRSTYYGAFSSKAAAVLNASQGWSLDGRIAFREVGSGCDFDLILASPQEVEALGTICDAAWSCRVGRNVAINVERWNNATQAWTGSLEGYRTMVVNHEVGHWLGFGHSNCPTAGAQAPVMQQQSINLQGCQANPWPTPVERQSLASRKGIT